MWFGFGFGGSCCVIWFDCWLIWTYSFGALGVGLCLLLLGGLLFVLLVGWFGWGVAWFVCFCTFKVKLPFSFALAWVCVGWLTFSCYDYFAGLLLVFVACTDVCLVFGYLLFVVVLGGFVVCFVVCLIVVGSCLYCLVIVWRVVCVVVLLFCLFACLFCYVIWCLVFGRVGCLVLGVWLFGWLIGFGFSCYLCLLVAICLGWFYFGGGCWFGASFRLFALFN